MTDAQARRRLEMIHAQAASLLVSVETMMADMNDGAPSQASCTHPPEQREKISTLADSKPRFRCRACGEENV